MARSEHENWKPIPVAATEAKIPPRSAYNWARAGKLETRSEKGRLLVDPAALAALARERAAKNGSATAGTSASTGNGMASGTKRAPEDDGELSARVFAALKRGEALEDIIERMQLPAPAALALYDQFEKVRAAAKSGPSVLERLAALEKESAEVAALARATANEVASIWSVLSLTQEMAEGSSMELARIRPILSQLTDAVRQLAYDFNAEIAAR